MQNQNRFQALYALFVGIAIIALWAMLLLTGQVPELHTTPFTTVTHISAETLTGLMLTLTGFGLWLNKAWAKRLYPISLGMLLYAVVQAVGYYIDHFDAASIVMFAILIVLTVFLIIRYLSSQNNP